MSGARDFWLSACRCLGRTATGRCGDETAAVRRGQQQLHGMPGTHSQRTVTETKAAHSVGVFQNSARCVRGAIPLSCSATGMPFALFTMIGLGSAGRTEHSHSMHGVVTVRAARFRSPN